MAGRINSKNLKRGISYIKRNGIVSGYYKAVERLVRDNDEADYTQKVVSALLTMDDIKKQRTAVFKKPYLISILVPAYKTEEYLLRELLKSVVSQTYTNWELVIADASPDDSLKGVIDAFCADYHPSTIDGSDTAADTISSIDISEKIKYRHLDENGGISANTNAALSFATGDYVAFLDHDDVLVQDALFEVISVLNGCSAIAYKQGQSGSGVRFVYSDEDKVSYDGSEFFDWHRKTDFDPVMLLTNNYICHFTVVDAKLAREVGGLNPDIDGSQDYDFVLKCFEKLKDEEIVHIPKVLYHWRSSAASTAENPEAKLYAYEAGRKAISESLSRRSIKAEVVSTEHLGFFYVKFDNLDGSVKHMDDVEYAAMNENTFNAIEEDYIMVISRNLRSKTDYTELLKSVMVLPNVGASTGKIIKDGRIESAGYCVDIRQGVKPYFAGLNEHFSGYLHRASLLRSVDAYDSGCVLLKKSALRWNGDGPVLNDGYRCVYVPEAIYKRK